MPDNKYGYVEHETAEVAGFLITDATSTGPRPHDDLIWVGYRNDGRWLTPDEALAIAAAINKVAYSHIERHRTPNLGCVES
jgi:hypothetical protein